MSLAQGTVQTAFCLNLEEDEDEIECRQTISDITIDPDPDNNLKHCHCRCRCGMTQDIQDPNQKKRQKRKQYKKRQKLRMKEAKQKSLNMLQQIIKDIYSLQVNFAAGKRALQQCISIQSNRQKLYEFINFVIRQEVDLIRRELVRCLIVYPQHQNQQIEAQIIKKVFDLIERIKKASPEIQKIINLLFISCHFDTDGVELPFQRNLDQMTLKFLVKNDLQKSENFALICTKLFHEQDKYQRERELFNFMMKAYKQPDYHEAQNQEDSEDGYESGSQDWDEESTGDSIRTDNQNMQQSESRTRKRRSRRRKFKQDYQNNYEVILRRTQDMQIRQQERVNCNVTQDWIDRMKLRQQSYRHRNKQSQ